MWKQALENLKAGAWKIVESALPKGTMATTEVIRDTSGVLQKVITIDPKQATYLGMLHESKHVLQVESLLRSGNLALVSPLESKVLATAELSAYRFEARVVKMYANQSVNRTATETYWTELWETIDRHDSLSLYPREVVKSTVEQLRSIR